jgi:hypothetical protein
VVDTPEQRALMTRVANLEARVARLEKLVAILADSAIPVAGGAMKEMTESDYALSRELRSKLITAKTDTKALDKGV